MTVNQTGEIHFSKFDKRVIAWFAGVGGTLLTAAVITSISILLTLQSNYRVMQTQIVTIEKQTEAMQAAILADGRTVARMQSTLDALNETLRELRADLRNHRTP